MVRWVVDGVAFDDRYRLALAGFGLESANQDGVLEPGEEVIVHGITVTNRGAVPTPPPALHPTRIYLPATRNVSAPSEPLLLPVSVGRGQSHTLAETLRFTIPDIDVETAVRPDVRWSDEGLVDPRAHLADARRDHPEFPGAKTFPLAFPLVLRPVRFAAAVGAGETRKVALEVENVSTKPFGAAVDEWLAARGLPAQSALRRAIRVTLAFRGTTLRADEVQLLDPAGRPVPLGAGPFEWDLAALGPGERARAEVSLGLRPDATPYAGAELAIDLHLGRIGRAPEERRVIERRRVPVRVASPWRAPDRPSLLLVTNMGVERDVVRAWRGLAAGLGLGLAVWDVSYHGHLPLGARTDRTDALLMEACAGQPAVVLCNTFASPIEDEQGVHAPAVARSFLAPDEVARAAARHGLGLLLVGGVAPDESGLRAEGPSASRAALLVPVQPPKKVREHASPAALLAALDAEGETDADPDALERVAVKDGWLWGQPELGELHGFARGLARELEARWPDRRYVIVSRFRPATDDRWYWNAFDYGHLEVRRTVDRSVGVHALPLGEADLARGEAVLGPAALEAALGPLPFARKLELLRRFLEGELPARAPAGLAQLSPEALGDALAAAILHDLHVERTVWRQRSWSGLRTSGWYRERLRHHRALAALQLSRPVAAGSAAAGCAARIVEDVKWRGGWWEAWDVVVPLHAARYYVACATAGTSAGRGLIDDFADRVFGAGAAVPAAAVPAPRSGPEPERGDASLASTACLSEDELQASCALEADRAARRAAFQEALDRLRIATELGEGLGGR